MLSQKIFLLFIVILSLVSFALSTQCRDGSFCPGRQTCCLAMYGVGCCPYENAICCGDGMHCCPEGYICGDNSCYRSTGEGITSASLLTKSNLKIFLDNSEDIVKSSSTNKMVNIAQSLINFASNTDVNKDENNKTQKEKLEFLNEDATKTTTTIIKNDSTTTSIVSKSRFQSIMEKFEYLNGSYFRKLLGCFKDMEPVIKDLMNAYREKSENKSESLMKIVSELVNKLYFDGKKISEDCKGLLALAGIAGIF